MADELHLKSDYQKRDEHHEMEMFHFQWDENHEMDMFNFHAMGPVGIGILKSGHS